MQRRIGRRFRRRESTQLVEVVAREGVASMQQLVLKPAGETRCVGRVPDGENRGLMGYSWGGMGR
jgi:hypothetical protein